MQEISKKDLLKETKISYGQLYRWKREGLIPEDWFVKRSAPTGQETYFPKAQVLARVQAILEMKDDHSLEEIRDALDFGSSACFASEVLVIMTGMDAKTLARLRLAKEAMLTLEAWAFVAGVYEAGAEAGLSCGDLVALTDEALAKALSSSWPGRAHKVGERSAVESSQAGVAVAAAQADATGYPSISQVSVLSVGGAHHFITSSALAELQGDATLVVKATRHLQTYKDRAQAALRSKT